MSALGCPKPDAAEPIDAGAPPAEVTVIVTSTTTGASITTKLGDPAHPDSAASAEDRAAVRATVLARKDEVRACYEKALARRPSLEGTVLVEWHILPSGQLDAVSIGEPRIGDPDLEACITTVARSWTFPVGEAGGGKVLVRYPFRFVRRE